MSERPICETCGEYEKDCEGHDPAIPDAESALANEQSIVNMRREKARHEKLVAAYRELESAHVDALDRRLKNDHVAMAAPGVTGRVYAARAEVARLEGGAARMKHRDHATRYFLTRLKQLGIAPPDQEVIFHSNRKWRLDFAWITVAVEIHGGVYSHGRHTRGKGFESDREKMNEAQLAGWTVLEFSTGQILDDSFIDQLERAMAG